MLITSPLRSALRVILSMEWGPKVTAICLVSSFGTAKQSNSNIAIITISVRDQRETGEFPDLVQ